MTFADRLAADVTRMLSTDEFAETITYRYPSGTETTFDAQVFPMVSEKRDTNGIYTIVYRRYCCWSAASLSSPDLRSTIILADETEWSISSEQLYEDDQQVSVMLERHLLHEQTRPGFRAI